MYLHSINPHSGERIASYPVHADQEISRLLDEQERIQRQWSRELPARRSEVLEELARCLLRDQEHLARLMAIEMGKPVTQGRAEISKCAWCCRYYAEHLGSFLAPREEKTGATWSGVVREPMGIWLAIMPWNFPFWQVIRCLAPALGAGNTVLLKHASNVTGCALELERLVTEAAGRPLLRALRIPSDRVAEWIRNPRIRGISFTGSEHAGSRVAAMAGAHVKPAVLELGGSCAFIVLPDAPMAETIRDALTGRFQNAGQSCIAAKRFLVHRDVAEAFREGFVSGARAIRMGDPLLDETEMGPLARAEFAATLQGQVDRSLEAGAECWLGGEPNGARFPPTVLGKAATHMAVMQEEVFGPVAAITEFSTLEEAISLSNSTRFGLGVSVYTADPEAIRPSLSRFEEGGVFLNSIVHSDPRMPFGGVKASGVGRELSIEGILHFVNSKTIYIK